MKFRTEIEPLRNRQPINHDAPILLLGSCFTDEIGSRLCRDGFNCQSNPMGPLYNPASLARVLIRALSDKCYTPGDITVYEDTFHCLDFKSAYQATDMASLLDMVNTDFARLADSVRNSNTWIITFGTSRIFSLDGTNIVGNCHKLPASRFTERYLNVDEIVNLWQPLLKKHRIIFTISPIRHLNDGLHYNQLSKSRLLLAVEELCTIGAEYFPSYEILLDDLRDYRFYAADMKHPSPVAADYIYDIFSDTYFTPSTKAIALSARKQTLHSAHRPILPQ